MSPKEFMFLASGNTAAAMYVARHEKRRRSPQRIDGGWATADQSSASTRSDYSKVEWLWAKYANYKQNQELIKWLLSASLEDLKNCRLGLVTAGNMVAWANISDTAHKTDIDGLHELMFSGSVRTPETQTFVRVIVLTSDGFVASTGLLREHVNAVVGDTISTIFTMRVNV